MTTHDRTRDGAHDRTHDREEHITQIISEFSEVFAFARSRWGSYAAEVHPDLKGVGMIVLQLVLRKGPITATTICHMLDMDKAVVSRQVSQLRELGLVEAQPSPEDGRVMLLTPTEEAESLVARMRERWSEAYRERFSAWSTEELAQLGGNLRRFNESEAG